MVIKYTQFIAVWLAIYQKPLLLWGFVVRIGLPWGTDANPEMETDRADEDRPGIQVVDYVYKSPTLPHTNLQDASPIVDSGV